MKQKLLTAVFGLVLAANAHADNAILRCVLDWSPDEMAVHQDYAEEWSFFCKIAAEDAYQLLAQTYVVPREEQIYVRKLLLERESRKATYNILDHTPWDRVASKKRIDELYQDSIDIRLLTDNKKIAGANISLALRFSDHWKLSRDNHAKILKLGLKIAKLIRKDPNYNYDVEVMDSLRNYFNRSQLVEILSAKHALSCIEKGVATWKELQNAGMVMDEDSATCCNQAIDYYTMECVINELFVGHEKQLKNNLSDLRKQQPLIVRMSGSLRNREALMEKKQESEPDVNDMKW